MMAEPASDDSLTAIDDTSDKHSAAARRTSTTKLIFNDEVQRAIEQVGAIAIDVFQSFYLYLEP